MYYQYEWLSDLAIIPAFEIFLAGIMLGGLLIGLVWWAEMRKHKREENGAGDSYPTPFYPETCVSPKKMHVAEREEPSMTEKQQKAAYIANKCLIAGMTLAGAAGAIINFDCESLISEINVEDRYHSDTGKTDADYVHMVDNCPGYDFETDSGRHYGFGLAQWTLASRKRKMREFHNERGVSIGDFRTQVDFFLHECRKDFTDVWSTLCSSDSPYQCAYKFCLIYENPKNARAQAAYRAGKAKEWYDWLSALMKENGLELPTPDTDAATADSPAEPTKDDEGLPIPKTWPPRTIDSHCSGWPEVELLQALLACHGYNVLVNGIFPGDTEKKLEAFQEDNRLVKDRICGPKTWAALGIKMK